MWAYCVINDATARDLQAKHKQWLLGKSIDTFCPIGPWLTTADEVEPGNLELQFRKNYTRFVDPSDREPPPEAVSDDA